VFVGVACEYHEYRNGQRSKVGKVIDQHVRQSEPSAVRFAFGGLLHLVDPSSPRSPASAGRFCF